MREGLVQDSQQYMAWCQRLFIESGCLHSEWPPVLSFLCHESQTEMSFNTRLNNGRTRWTCHWGELERRRGLQLKLSKNRLACCLHTIYYKRLYILMYVWHIYKYMECSILFYCGHEENMHKACVGQRVLVTGCDILVVVTREYGWLSYGIVVGGSVGTPHSHHAPCRLHKMRM